MRPQPSVRTVLIVIIALAALLCTLFSLACLGQDATIAALSVSVTAILMSGFGIIMLTFFLTEKKNARPSVVLNTVRPNPLEQFQMSQLPPLPPYPAFVPPFPMPPPQIVSDAATTVAILPPPIAISPPTYSESADIEDRRVTDSSNAPPAYNATDTVADNNIASFSPPPYYSPPSPFFGTSVQTTTMYLSAEDMSVSPVPTSPMPQVQMRAPSPVRRHPARKTRRQSPRQPKPQQVVVTIEEEQPGASTSTAAPKTPTRTSLPQMFIDCSKAEPTLFTINGEESII